MRTTTTERRLLEQGTRRSNAIHFGFLRWIRKGRSESGTAVVFPGLGKRSLRIGLRITHKISGSDGR